MIWNQPKDFLSLTIPYATMTWISWVTMDDRADIMKKMIEQAIEGLDKAPTG